MTSLCQRLPTLTLPATVGLPARRTGRLRFAALASATPSDFRLGKNRSRHAAESRYPSATFIPAVLRAFVAGAVGRFGGKESADEAE